jgi:hypothetical protein
VKTVNTLELVAVCKELHQSNASWIAPISNKTDLAHLSTV